MIQIQAGMNIPGEPLPIEWPEEKVHPFQAGGMKTLQALIHLRAD
jgi:hypothetical protein